MVLKLYWKDLEEETYNLGELYKKDNIYYFNINEDKLKKAIKKGCFGIGEINLLYNEHKSDKLFDFFKRRIPSKDNINIEEILRQLELEEYDEMELLKRTKGILNTDRYYLE